MATGKQIRCVVVTPEQAVLDESADFAAIPMFDGELGIMAGRSPLIGRLGTGEMRIKSGSHVRHLFVDGGFVQIRNDVVTMLTEKAIAADKLQVTALQAELQAALSQPMTTAIQMTAAKRAQTAARAKLRIAQRKA